MNSHKHLRHLTAICIYKCTRLQTFLEDSLIKTIHITMFSAILMTCFQGSNVLFPVCVLFIVDVFVCLFVCMLMMFLCLLPAVCLFGGRELVEGDQKAVRDSSGRCLLFECRVSYVNAHTHTGKRHHNNSCNQALQLYYFPCIAMHDSSLNTHSRAILAQPERINQAGMSQNARLSTSAEFP